MRSNIEGNRIDGSILMSGNKLGALTQTLAGTFTGDGEFVSRGRAYSTLAGALAGVVEPIQVAARPSSVGRNANAGLAAWREAVA